MVAICFSFGAGQAPRDLSDLQPGSLFGHRRVYWAAALALAVAAESTYLDDQLGVGMKRTDYEPGMLGFDPLGLDSKVTRNAEIWLGRVGMIVS